MKTHEFTVVLKRTDLSEAQVERLFSAGCDDCLPVVRDQVASLKFSRRDDDLESAIRSACLQVEASGLKISRILYGH